MLEVDDLYSPLDSGMLQVQEGWYLEGPCPSLQGC